VIVFFLGLLMAADCGKIEYVRGEVHIIRVKPGEEKKANPVRNGITVKKAPFALQCLDGLRTGPSSRAKIKISKGTLSLGPNSQLLVEKFSEPKEDIETLNMLYGKIRAVIDPKKNKNKNKTFKIKTPSSVAGVRGTDFYVEFDPVSNLTKQATLTGSVEVEQKGTKQKVIVSAGNQVEVEKIKFKPEKQKKRKEINKNKVATSLPAKQVVTTEPLYVEPEVISAPLVVKKIQETVKIQIRSTSAIVKNDKTFTSKQAVEILGAPEKWQPTKDEVPLDFQDLENVF